MAQNVSMTMHPEFVQLSEFSQFPQNIDLTFLPMLYIWTDASVLSYVKMSYAKDWIPQIGG